MSQTIADLKAQGWEHYGWAKSGTGNRFELLQGPPEIKETPNLYGWVKTNGVRRLLRMEALDAQ